MPVLTYAQVVVNRLRPQHGGLHEAQARHGHPARDSDGLMMGKGHKVPLLPPIAEHCRDSCQPAHCLRDIVFAGLHSRPNAVRHGARQYILDGLSAHLTSCTRFLYRRTGGDEDTVPCLCAAQAALGISNIAALICVDRVGHGARGSGDPPAQLQRHHARDDGLRRRLCASRPHCAYPVVMTEPCR